MSAGRSSYATQIADLRSDKRRPGAPFGLCVHNSGSGPIDRAKRDERHPDECALDYYDSAKYSTHYVAGHRGFYQISDDLERVSHVGYTDGVGGYMTPGARLRWYRSGRWRDQMPQAFVIRWSRAWYGYESPADLHPSDFPNADYVAIEVIPCGYDWGQRFAGGRFSLAQHITIALCGAELAARHGWPDGWENTPRLVGHEDVGPHSRVRRGAAWDPGRHRSDPWIDWATIKAWIVIARAHGLDVLANTARLVGGWDL